MSDPNDDDVCSLFRRRSILGPPSLFPSQKTSEAGIDPGPEKIGVTGGELSSSSQPCTQDISEEISLAIADLDFYYGLGNAHTCTQGVLGPFYLFLTHTSSISPTPLKNASCGRTRGFQKTQVGSNEREFCGDGLESHKNRRSR